MSQYSILIKKLSKIKKDKIYFDFISFKNKELKSNFILIIFCLLASGFAFVMRDEFGKEICLSPTDTTSRVQIAASSLCNNIQNIRDFILKIFIIIFPFICLFLLLRITFSSLLKERNFKNYLNEKVNSINLLTAIEIAFNQEEKKNLINKLKTSLSENLYSKLKNFTLWDLYLFENELIKELEYSLVSKNKKDKIVISEIEK